MSRMIVIAICGLAGVLNATSDSLWAEEWGTVKGRLVFNGDVPKAEVLEIARDPEVCGKHQLVDESLVVNQDNSGLTNVVVWLYSKTQVPVHPSLKELPKPADLDNKHCRFVPRIVQLRTNQILRSTNSDSVAHNVAVYARRNQPFSIIVPQEMPLEKSFPRGELLPIRVDCSIHSWMRAYLVITDHPYSAVSDKNGNFKIEQVPHGEWQFRFWHERPGYLTKLEGRQSYELERGVLKLDVAAAEVDLGQLKVNVDEFAKDD